MTPAIQTQAESYTTALDMDFPIVEISQIAEHESWRKEIHRPIYHIHKWWATRLGSVFRGITLAALSEPDVNVWKAFYQNQNFSTKVVLDPFMGSGTTVGESIKLGAKVIGCDINPISTFQVRQAFTRVDEQKLRDAFGELERKVAPKIRRYYETFDPETGKLIPVLYYFWAMIVTTADGEAIPLMSRYVFSQDAYPKKKPAAKILCPECWAIIEDRYDSTNVTCPECSWHFNPQNGPASGQHVTSRKGHSFRIKDIVSKSGQPPQHRMYAIMAIRHDGEKIYLVPQKEDLDLFLAAENELSVSPLPLPSLPVRSGHNTDQARGYNYFLWRDFFNARQLLCLGILLQGILEIEDEQVQEQMLCLFSSTLEFNNMFCSFKGEGTGAVRHMFSNHILKPERTPLENSVWGTQKSSGTFSTLFESRLLRAKHYLDEPYEVGFEYDLFGERQCPKKTVASIPIQVDIVDSWDHFVKSSNSMMILNGDSACLPLPDKVVDAIVTDPPYFDFVHYSELSDFFFAWLSPVLKQRYHWFSGKDSSDNGEVQHKDPHCFARQLALVFRECERVLKNDGLLSFSFHHSRPEGWAAILEAITQAGFVVTASHPVHAELRAASPKSATKVPISIDAILVCKKKTITNVSHLSEEMLMEKSFQLFKKLKKAGMKLSINDQFVILASQLLVVLSHKGYNFASACAIFREFQESRMDIFMERSTS